MWSKLPPKFVARMLSGHTVVGLAASALLYILCVSGTVMVFHEEFARWEQPGAPEFMEYSPEAVETAAVNALARVEHPHHFFIGLPVENLPRMIVTADEQEWHADANGVLHEPVSHPWAHFVEKLHYYLTLPGVWGLTLVGALGVLMTALVISGLLSHPKLFRDAFHLRRNGNPRLRETDTHNRLGAWAAPFHLVIAYTGAALGLATLAAYLLMPISEYSDLEEFFSPIFGIELEGDPSPAPLADVSSGLRNLEIQHPDVIPWFVVWHDPATQGQTAYILGQHPRRLIYGDNYTFDVDGTLTGNLGLSDGSLGQQVTASLYPLHFGSFGGIWVKLAYGVLGLLACVMTASGFNIWLLKRRQRGRPVPLLERSWQATVWGTPFAMALVLALAVLGVTALGFLVAAFWLSLVALLAIAAIQENFSAAWLRTATGLLLMVTLFVHLFQNVDAFTSPAAFGVSISIAVLAAWFVQDGWRKWRSPRSLPLEVSESKA